MAQTKTVEWIKVITPKTRGKKVEGRNLFDNYL